MARSRGKGWVADVSAPTGRRRFSGFPTRAKADAFKAQCLVAIEAGEPLPVPDKSTGAVAPTTLNWALRVTSESVWAFQRTPRKIKERHVVSFAAGLPKALDTPVKELNAGHLTAWVARMKHCGNSAATINKKLAALAGVLNTAKDANQCPNAPAMPWQDVSDTGRITIFSAAQEAYFWKALRDTCPDFADFFVFLIETGMRRGEATKFKVLDGEAVDAAWLTADITKSGRARLVPLTLQAQAVLAPYIRPGERPFGHIIPDNFTEAVRCVRLSSPWADDEDLTPHALRHTCATRLVRRGVPVTVVKLWMGHASLDQTMAYVHEGEADLLAAATAHQRGHDGTDNAGSTGGTPPG